jgi:hypothetical protein
MLNKLLLDTIKKRFNFKYTPLSYDKILKKVHLIKV